MFVIGNARRVVKSAATIGTPPPYFSGFQDTLATAAFQHEIMPCASGQLNIELPMERAGNIEGKVTIEQTGEPAKGVKLLLLSFGSGLPGLEMRDSVFSGADGSYRLTDVAPGRRTIAAVVPGEGVADWAAEDVTKEVVAGQTSQDFQLQAVKGIIAAITVLRRTSREPLANVTVAQMGGPWNRGRCLPATTSSISA